MILKIQMLAIDSTNLNTLKYMYASQNNEVSLNTKGTVDAEFKNGTLYRYNNVPFGTYLDIMLADSKGKAFNSKIVGVFEYERLRS